MPDQIIFARIFVDPLPEQLYYRKFWGGSCPPCPPGPYAYEHTHLLLKQMVNIEQMLQIKTLIELLQRNRSGTGGLDYEIQDNKGARVMLPANISISDHLINGQMGTMFKIAVDKLENQLYFTLKMTT